MIPFINEYTSAGFSNPADDLNPDVKVGSKDYFLKKSMWFLSEYARDNCWMPYSRYSEIAEARLYAQARQPNEKYKSYLVGRGKKGGQVPTERNPGEQNFGRKSWYNISWDIFPIYPKFRNKVRGLFSDLDFNISAEAIDEASSSKIQERIAQVLFVKLNPDFHQKFQQLTGIDASGNPQDQAIDIQSMDEGDMFRRMGGFKLHEEIAMEALTKWSFKLSNWHEIKDQLIEDFIDHGYAIVKDYTDPKTLKVKGRYADPAHTIIRKGRANDSSDITEAGEVKFFSLAMLRDLGVKDDDLLKIGQKYASQPYNTGIGGIFGDNAIYDHNTHSRYKVAVLDWEFESFDFTIYRVREGNDGKKRAYEEPYRADGKLSQATTTESKKIVKDGRRRWYKAMWVIGTDIVFDYGYQKDVAYDEETPRSSYSCYRISDRGITSMCIPTIDEICMDVYRLRNAKSKARPAGIAVEITALHEITINGQIMSPMEMLTMSQQTGDLLYKTPLDKQGLVRQGIGNPVTEREGGMGRYFSEIVQAIGYGIQNLQTITGINAVVDASNPSPNQAVGVSEIAQQSTNDVLKPIINGYRSIKRTVANNFAIRWQCVAAFAPEKFASFGEAVGYGSIATVLSSIAKDVATCRYAIFMEAVVDDAMKKTIYDTAMISMNAAKQGQVGISPADFFFIMRELEQGNLKMAQFYLSYKEAKNKADAEKLQQDNMKMNGQNMAQQEQMKGQNAQQAAAMQAQMLKEQQDAKTEADLLLIQEKGKQDRMTLAFEYENAPVKVSA